MTDTQLLTLALAVIIPVSVMIYSNSRITDVKKGLDDRISDAKKSLEDRMGAMEKSLEERIDNGFAHMELLLKLHEAEHHHKE